MTRVDAPFLHVAAVAALLASPALAGCMGGPGGANVDPSLALTPIQKNATTAAGHSVSFPLTVGGEAPNSSISLEVVSSGSFSVETTPARNNTPNGTGFFVTVDVPSDAGSGAIEVRATTGNATGPVTTLQVNVEEPEEVVRFGDQVRFDWIGRYPNGSVIATSLPAVGNGSFPKAPLFQAPQTYEPLTINVTRNNSLLRNGEFIPQLPGIGVGHDRSFSTHVNETLEKTRPRTKTLERNLTEPRFFPGVNRTVLEQRGYIDENTTEGDNFTFGQPPHERVFNITSLNETSANLTWTVEVGDHYTHRRFAAWPNSSEAVFVNETTVSWRVTPTTELNEFFTWHEYWPNATKVTEVTNETITIKHSPEIGTTWTPQRRSPPGRSPPERTVVDLTEESVVYTMPNQGPLAGETLVFDVHILEATPPGGG